MTTPPLPTIYALSSGQPPAAIAVVRLSGPAAFDAARALTTRDLPGSRQAALRRFVDPDTAEVIDEGLLILFPGPRTETGEDMAELHCHGSHAVLRGLEAVLGRRPGLRLAEPGEFTRRAFLNGKIDLSGIEGLGDLLAAETALQRRAAMAMMGGALSRRIATWTDALRGLAARVEAQLDFSDEGDVADQGAAIADLVSAGGAIARDMDAELARPSAERLKDGIRVAIGGPPNAGKSTLLNALIGRDAAIVSPIAGTTRDIIEVPVAIEGLPMVLSDSAGLRVSGDAIEQIGVERAQALLATADIVLWLGAERDQPMTDATVIQIAAKADIASQTGEAGQGLPVSALTGDGITQLVERLADAARSLLPMPGDYALSQRQRGILARAAKSLHDMAGQTDEILIGESLRLALSALDEITGRATTDAVLDELFSGFCIGK